MNREELHAALFEYERALPNGRSDEKLLKEIQRALGDLLIETLEHIGEKELGYWEKEQLSFGINRYAGNVTAWAPGAFGIRMCLQAMDNALIPRNERNEDYTEDVDPYVDSLTFERLVHAVRKIRHHVG
jgi:hypothetical protein